MKKTLALVALLLVSFSGCAQVATNWDIELALAQCNLHGGVYDMTMVVVEGGAVEEKDHVRCQDGSVHPFDP